MGRHIFTKQYGSLRFEEPFVFFYLKELAKGEVEGIGNKVASKISLEGSGNTARKVIAKMCSEGGQ